MQKKISKRANSGDGGSSYDKINSSSGDYKKKKKYILFATDTKKDDQKETPKKNTSSSSLTASLLLSSKSSSSSSSDIKKKEEGKLSSSIVPPVSCMSSVKDFVIQTMDGVCCCQCVQLSSSSACYNCFWGNKSSTKTKTKEEASSSTHAIHQHVITSNPIANPTMSAAYHKPQLLLLQPSQDSFCSSPHFFPKKEKLLLLPQSTQGGKAMLAVKEQSVALGDSSRIYVKEKDTTEQNEDVINMMKVEKQADDDNHMVIVEDGDCIDEENGNGDTPSITSKKERADSLLIDIQKIEKSTAEEIKIQAKTSNITIRLPLDLTSSYSLIGSYLSPQSSSTAKTKQTNNAVDDLTFQATITWCSTQFKPLLLSEEEICLVSEGEGGGGEGAIIYSKQDLLVLKCQVKPMFCTCPWGVSSQKKCCKECEAYHKKTLGHPKTMCVKLRYPLEAHEVEASMLCAYAEEEGGSVRHLLPQLYALIEVKMSPHGPKWGGICMEYVPFSVGILMFPGECAKSNQCVQIVSRAYYSHCCRLQLKPAKKKDTQEKQQPKKEGVYLQDGDDLETALLTGCMQLLHKLHMLGIVHGDTHLGNFMLDISTCRLYCIDLERSFKTTDPAHQLTDMQELFGHATKLLVSPKRHGIWDMVDVPGVLSLLHPFILSEKDTRKEKEVEDAMLFLPVCTCFTHEDISARKDGCHMCKSPFFKRVTECYQHNPQKYISAVQLASLDKLRDDIHKARRGVRRDLRQIGRDLRSALPLIKKGKIDTSSLDLNTSLGVSQFQEWLADILFSGAFIKDGRVTGELVAKCLRQNHGFESLAKQILDVMPRYYC